MFLAYGDYGANTGPIHALTVDLDNWAAGVVDEGALTTEETWRFLPIGGTAVAPFLDPQGGIGNPENGGYAVRQTDGTWVAVTSMSPYPVHMTNLVVTSEGWWAFGASQIGDPGTSAAQVWFSADNGATWASSLAVPGTDDDTRFYAGLHFGDDLLAVSVTAGGTSRLWYRPASGAWAELSHDNTPLADAVPFTYQGTAFWLGWQHAKDYGQVQATFVNVWVHPDDAAERATIQASLPFTSIFDAFATDTALYVLDPFGVLHKGTTAGVWSTVDVVIDAFAVSLLVDETAGYVYFGTTDSRLLRVALPA